MSIITGVPLVAIWKVLRRVRESSSLTQEQCGYLLKTITTRKDNALLRSIIGKSFLLASRVRLILITRNGLWPHGPKMFCSSCISLKTSRPMSQSKPWPSPLPHIGTHSPELEPSGLVSCDIYWVHRQPLQLSWACSRYSLCCWKASRLLHPRKRWNARAS